MPLTSHVATCPSLEIMYSRKKLFWTARSVMFATEEGHVANDRVQHELIGGRRGKKTLASSYKLRWKKINKCKRHDDEGDSENGVLISRKVSLETRRTKTDGHMVNRLPYEASLITRNPFMRWLFACNATNMGPMRNTGAAWRRRRLPTITKRISENPDVLCIESDSAVGLSERH